MDAPKTCLGTFTDSWISSQVQKIRISGACASQSDPDRSGLETTALGQAPLPFTVDLVQMLTIARFALQNDLSEEARLGLGDTQERRDHG
jgi:hypothetical protein